MSAPACCAIKSKEFVEVKLAKHACCTIPGSSPQAACDAAKHVVPSAMGQTVIGKMCPGCKCIAELQIVAIPGIALSEKTFRFGDVTPVAENSSTLPTELWAESWQERVHPGIVITLQTCSIRC